MTVQKANESKTMKPIEKKIASPGISSIEKMAIVTAIREAEIILGDLEHEMCCCTAGEVLGWPDDVEHGTKIWHVYITMKPSRKKSEV